MSTNKSGIYVFPHSLREFELTGEGNFPYLEISLVERSISPGDEGPRFKTLNVYIPPAISTADSANYGNADLGKIASLARNVVTKGLEVAAENINESDILEVAKSTVMDFIGSVTPSITSSISVSARQISNPNTVAEFTGMSPRTFAINIKMTPESESESNEIREIENFFRFYMYPELEGTFMLKYPAIFRVKFKYGENENRFMPYYQDAYLESMNVAYNGEGNSYHKDGAPLSVDMALTFKEIRALTRKDIYDVNAEYNYEKREDAYILQDALGNVAKQVREAATEELREFFGGNG